MMLKYNQNTEILVRMFCELLNDYPDREESTSAFLNYVRLVLKYKVSNLKLPLIEIMTLFKEYKPRIYQSI